LIGVRAEETVASHRRRDPDAARRSELRERGDVRLSELRACPREARALGEKVRVIALGKLEAALQANAVDDETGA
jgi:hypothetical protein